MCCSDIPILGDIEEVVRDIGSAFDDAVLQPIGDVVEDVVEGVGDVLEKVADTVTSVLENPKALAGVALSIAFPGAGTALGTALGLGTGAVAQIAGQALINATINGGDVKSAVIGAVLPVAGQEVASTLSQTLASSNITGTVNGIITRAATQAATAEILGRDPLTAFVMGGVSAGVGAITSDIPGFRDLPASAQNAISSAIGTKLVDGNVQNAVVDSLVDDAIQWAKGQVNKAPAAIKTAQEKYKAEFGKDIPEAQIAEAVETGGFDFLVASTNSLVDILGTLDNTQKAKAIKKIDNSSIGLTDAANYSPKDWLDELYLGEFPTVNIVADKEKGWKHTTDDSGYTVMWNEDKGLVQLYDENDKLLKSLTNQFRKDGDGNVIGRNLDYYLTVAQDSFWRSGQQTASLIADVLPAMAAKAVGNEDYFKKQMSEAQAVMERVKRDYPSRVPSYKNVNDLGSAATYVLESVMEGVVTTAPTLLMGGAAGVAARASAKAAMDSAIKKELAEQAAKGVFGAEAIAAAQSAAARAGLAVAAKYTTPAILAGSASQNIPEVFKNVYDAKSGKVDLKDLAISTVVGSFNAALDAVLPSAIVDRLNLSKIPVDEVIGAWYKTAAKEGGSAFLKEGGTEVLQEMSSAGAESFLAENKDFFTSENLERFVNAGLKGGIGGSTISTGFALGKDAAQAGRSLNSSEIIQQGMDKTTPAEYLAASQMFRDSGFNATASDIAAVTGGGTELQSDELKSALSAYMDPRVVDEQEARQALIDLGYTDPDQKEIQAFVGQRDEAAALKEIESQYDPLATTPEEAQQMMRDLGYTNLTNEEAQSLAGKIKESEAQANIQTYVDPRMVTRGEAEQFFRSIGYNPTEEEIGQFIRQGSSVSQQGVESEVGAYVDPRLVTEQEVKDAYAALGLNKPTQADILKLVGQYEEAGLTGKATGNLESAKYNSLLEQIEQLGTRSNIDPAALEAIKSDLNTQITALGGDVSKLQAGLDSFVSNQAAADARLTDLQKNLSDEIKAARDIGLEGDAAIQAGLDSLAGKVGTNQADLLAQLGTTAADLKAQFATDITGLETQMKAQYDALTASQKTAADALVAQGQTLQDAIAAAKTETSGQISGVETRLTDAIAAAEAMGLSRDQAITAAVDSVAAELGTTRADLLTRLGTTEAALRTEFGTGLAGVSAEVKAAYDSLSAEQKALANQLTQQGTDLATAIQQAQQQTQGQIGALSADMQAKYDALTAEQKALANDMAQQGMDLNAAINLAQQQTQAQITGLGQQVDARINELMQQGQTYQQATQQAIGELNQQNQQLQGLVGTQGRQATQADIDVMSQMLGGQRPMDLTYDVTGDKQITQADIDFLSQVVSGVKTDYTPPVGSFLGPTGLYGQLATNEAQRQADLQAQLTREQEAAAAAAEAQRRGKISATLAQGQQGLRQISQQLPQAFQQAQQVSTPIYGQMGEYLDLGAPLDYDFFKPSPEKQAATKQQQPTKIAAGGYIDDLLAGDMTADDLLNLLR